MTHVISRFHVALPAQFPRIDVHMPYTLHMYVSFSRLLVLLLLYDTLPPPPQHRRETLRGILGMDILRVYIADIAVEGVGMRGIMRGACNENVLLDSGREDSEKRVVNMFADQAEMKHAACGDEVTEWRRT